MADWLIRAPRNPSELAACFNLRWEILRQPWGEPRGSERDDRETAAHHRMAVTPDGRVIGVARLHPTTEDGGQIRFMAVHPDWRRQGIAAALLRALVTQAHVEGMRHIVLNARANAVAFYRRQGFIDCGPVPTILGISHRQMRRSL